MCRFSLVFALPICRFWHFLSLGRFLAGNAIFRHWLASFFLPSWKIPLQTEVMISWVQLSGGFCSFPWFSTNRGLFRSSIYKGNIEENQGNEQNPPDNCTQEIVTSVWSRIFHFGKKIFLIGTQILHFRREIDLGAPLLKTLKVALRTCMLRYL